ncbi:cell wall hydrolase [Sphingomonas sp. CARO-RG-8B-R24-01]|uniref:cell wall hydrolase n=1 Tax=Sphingomonas sp. CARO-RG-8B-R24-01 TaxID=2914831 RepID=UPI001F57D72B|nr:cell wall hydrolase [Sphingomonas sp. CARO-RG-8B-R24-01]
MISPIRLSILYSTLFVVSIGSGLLYLVYSVAFSSQDIVQLGDVPPPTVRSIQPRPADLPLEHFLPQQTLDLSATQAVARNLASALATTNPSPPPFDPSWLSETDFGAATTCLATAIYYEAAGEPIAGQQAVAQVVLNRLRNPHYPKTICGVVYEGADRRDGCQFTFSCDGSLARRPDPAALARARGIAEAALRGAISLPAGQATHYHAIWIVPRWAGDLSKVAIIGHHVFYRPPRPYGGYAMASVAPTLEHAEKPTEFATTMPLGPVGAPPVSATDLRDGPLAAPSRSATAPTEPVASTNPAAVPTASAKSPRDFYPKVRRDRPALAIPGT